MFDLTIFPLSLETGREQYELPGLLVVSAPRKAARMRAQDQLVLYCKLRTIPGGGSGVGASGQTSASLTHGQLREILSRLAETYFTFSGSVTAGLRVVVARLNDFLLNRNLKSAQEGQTVGTLNLAVIHGNRLVVAHAGATNSFVLTKNEVLHFDDSQAGRGLGLSRQVMPRFYQSALDAGDLLVVCAEAPAAWNDRMLANSPQLSFDHLRRRLSSNAGPELQVGVIRLQAGKGQISYWRPGEGGRAAERPSHQGRPAARPAAPAAAPDAQSERLASQTTGTLPERDETVSASGVLESTPEMGNSVPEGAQRYAVPEAHEIEAAALDNGLAQEDQLEKRTYAPDDLAYAPEELAYAPEDQAYAPEDLAFETENLTHAPDDRVGELEDAADAGERARETERAQETERARERAQESTTDAAVSTADTAESNRFMSAQGAPVSRTPDMPEGDRLAARSHEQPNNASPVTTPAASVARMRAARRGERSERDKSTLQNSKERRAPAKKSLPRRPSAFQVGLASLSASIRMAFYTAAQFLVKAVRRVSGEVGRAVPHQYDAEGHAVPFFNLSPAQMMAVAIFIPLIVVAVGTTVYVRSGLSEQFLERLSMAQGYAQQAAQLPDPTQQREGWKQAYTLLLEADKLGRNEESEALKRQIIKALDDLEGYVRLDYQPAVSGGLSEDVSITNIVATSNDVYLLDSSVGRILRLYRTASGYELDPKFSCGAGSAGTVIINPLIDLVALPANNEMHSTVMGIDSGGNLVYCAPNLTGFDSRPLALPDNGWGNIAGITLSGNTLYVLDPKGNAVYRYDGADGVFTERPHLYFDNTIPQMGDVVDLAVDQEFLYMLHADGRMTVCESSGFAFAATKCTDPAPYGDPRPGYEPAPLVFPGSHFIHIQTTEPPDPSLYALDATNKAIYHLSLRRMNLQRQYRSVVDGNFPLPNEAASAFSIAHRRVIIAFRNRVFFAAIP